MSETTAPTTFTPGYKQNVFNAIWFGEMISIIGSGLTGFALRVWAYEQTASVTQFALITFFYGLPGVLISPLAGVWVDRWDRRKTMIFSDMGAAMSTLGILLLVMTDQLQIWHVYIAVAIISLFGAIQEPASQATVSLLVPKEKLGRANGMMQIGPAASRIVAPFLAGLLLVTLGLKGIAQIDLATFLFAVIILLGVRIPNPARERTAAKEQKKSSYIEDAKLGWQYIRERIGFYYLLLLSIVINLTQGMVVVLIAPIVLSFADAQTLGWVFAVSGVGALLGAITMSVWGGPKRKMNGFIIFGFLRAILLLLGGLQPNALLIALASAFYLFFSQIANASLITIWQKKVPTQIQGRVFATVRIAATLFFPLGQILAGPLSDYVFQPMLELDGILASTVGKIIGVGSGRGIGFLLIVTGLINLIIMFFVYAHPRIRLIEDEIPDALPDEEETDADDDGTAVSTTKNQNTTNLQSRGEDMKTAKKWGLRIGLGLIALVILLAGYIYISLRRALPQTDGTLALPGLNDEVRIERDEWGTVQIYAENEHDLFFAQGFATAQDRMFQMEVFRRSPSGRMSEIVGDQAVFIDTFNRNMLMRETAELIWEQMDPDSKEILQAYTDGINAYLEENKNALPIEYKILMFEPEPWSPVDSLVWGNAISLQLSSNRRLELIRMQVFAAVGQEGMEMLFPYTAPDSPITVPAETAEAFSGFDQVDLRPFMEADDIYGSPLSGIGSNGWVVDGSMTESGDPIIANDIHIGLTMPSIWHAVGLHGGRFDVVGFTLPGVPGIITGHNANIGWSITNFGSDAQDFYLERLDDTLKPTQYQYDGEWYDLEHIQQTIEVRGGDPVTVDFYVTPHGPIMNYVLENPSFGHPLALRWVQHEGSTLFTSILKLNMASNWDEFQEALEGWDTPGQNIFYADQEGNIGYQAVGKIPIRPNGNGRLPVPGWTSENEWQGYVPYDELPSSYNPEQGFLLSANHRVEPEGYPYYLSDGYTPGYRAQQIEDLLKEYAPLSVEDMDLIQEDTFSPQAVQVMPYLEVIQANSPLEEAALDALLNWNLHTDIEGVGTSVYEAWQQRFLANIITDELGDETAQLYISGHYVRHATQQMPMLIDMLAQPDHPWFDNKNTPEVETRDDIIQQSFEEGVAWLTRLQGDDIANWDWGRIHSVTFPHQPFNQVAVLKNIFNSETYPMRGGNFSIYTNSYDWANPFKVWIVSSARHITDLGDFSNSVMLGSTGQNMNLLSPHREDVVRLWQEGSPIPMSYTEAEVEAVHESTLILQPGN
ncbi:MAG: MFS transporter [Ardenticatenaceae bacterium]|nr:MFS transporter [Ardenticatenaceae bacterium]